MNKRDVTFNKHSALIQMSNKITAVQRKSFNAMLYTAKEDLKIDPKMSKFKVTANSLLDLIGLGKKHHIYLKKFLTELKNINVEYNILGKDKKHIWGAFSLLAGFQYEKGDITYSFPHQILDALLDPNMYARINLKVIKGLKSKYSVALYEFIQDYKNLNHPITLKLIDLKKFLGVPNNKYTDSITMLRKKTLDYAVNEINQNSQIKYKISYKLLKTGRSYTHIKLSIGIKDDYSKKSESFLLDQKLPNTKYQPVKTKFENLPQSILEILPDKYRINSIFKLINNYLSKGFDEEYIISNIIYTSNHSSNNFPAYLAQALENDYATADRELQEKQKKAEQERIAREKAKKKQEKEKEKALLKAVENLPEDEYKSLENEALKILNRFIKKSSKQDPNEIKYMMIELYKHSNK